MTQICTGPFSSGGRIPLASLQYQGWMSGSHGIKSQAVHLTPASTDSGHKLLPSQSPDANQSINNRAHTHDSSSHKVSGNRCWLGPHKGCPPVSINGEWLCALLQNTPHSQSPPFASFIITGLLCLWLRRHCVALAPCLSASFSSSCSSSLSVLSSLLDSASWPSYISWIQQLSGRVLCL